MDKNIIQINDDYVKTFSLNVVQSINDINLLYVKKNSADKYNSHFIIIIESPIIPSININQLLENIFTQFWQYHILNVVIIYQSYDNNNDKQQQIISMITYSPFTDNFLINLPTNITGYEHIFWDKAKNLNGHPLRVSLFAELTRAVFHANGELTGTDGFITKAITDKMNASLILLPPTDGYDIGEFLKNGSVIGSLAQIVDHHVDVSFNTRFLRLAQFQGKVQITITNGRDDICILVAKAGYASNINNIFRTFSLIVWLLTFISLISITFSYTIINYSIEIENNNNNSNNYWLLSIMCRRIGAIFFDFYSWNLAQPIVKLPKYWSSKIIIGIWIIYGLLITSSYQGNLTSNLISRPTLPEINTIRQLEQSSYVVLTFGRYVDLLQNFLNQTGGTYNSLKKRIRSVKKSEMSKLIAENNINYAYANKFHINQYQSNLKEHIRRGRPIYYNMKECPVPYLVAYAVVYGSPYLQRINQLLRQLQESGLMVYWDEKSKGDHSKNGGPRSTDGEPVALTLDHVQSAFYILFLGLILALIIFFSELFRYKML